MGIILSFLAKVAKKAKKRFSWLFFKYKRRRFLGHVPVKMEQTKRGRLISALYVRLKKRSLLKNSCLKTSASSKVGVEFFTPDIMRGNFNKIEGGKKSIRKKDSQCRKTIERDPLVSSGFVCYVQRKKMEGGTICYSLL